MSEEKYVGEVVWFDNKKGYGFIAWNNNQEAQKDLFVHYSDIVSDGFKTLSKGQKVSFKIGLNKREQPKAVEVSLNK